MISCWAVGLISYRVVVLWVDMMWGALRLISCASLVLWDDTMGER